LPHLIPFSEVYPTKKLFTDYVCRKEPVRTILSSCFPDEVNFRQILAVLRGRVYERDELCTILEDQNRRYEAHDAVFRNIERLNREDSVAVIGGQQVGLFGGPLFTLFKIITVVKLAMAISRRYGIEAVPLFWLPGDDHDIQEVEWVVLPDMNGTPVRLEVNLGSPDERLPVKERLIPEEIVAVMDRIRDLLPATDRTQEVLGSMGQAYRPGTPVVAAFGRWMQKILGKWGVIFVDGSDPRLKRLARRLFRWEAERGSPVSAAVKKQTRVLEEHGYNAAVRAQQKVLTFFYHTPSRETVLVNDHTFRLKPSGRSFSRASFLQELEEHPERLSPNVLLRPLFQDFLFPTAAVVLGPSELAYFAQLPLAYGDAGIPMPILFPRASATLVDPGLERILKKYRLPIRELFQKKGGLLTEMVRAEIPDSLLQAISRSKQEVEKTVAQMNQVLAAFDPNLGRSAEVARNRILSQFDFLEKKLIQSMKRKDEDLRRQIGRVIGLLFPENRLQERVYSFLPYYVRLGDPFIERLFSRLDIFQFAHQVIFLSEKEEEK